MLFLVIITIFLLFYIIPVMKKYKTNETVLKKYEALYKKDKKELKYLEKKKKILKEKYKKTLTKYAQNFDQKDFINYLNLSFKNFKVEKIKKEKEQKYEVKGELDTIYDFTKLIEKINSYKNIVKINFPITISKKEKSYKVVFFVTVVNNKLKKDL